MLQVLYGWHGIPDGDGGFRSIHVPEETWENKYEPWLGELNNYVGYVHESVDSLETRTVTTLNKEIIMEHSSHVYICKVCGRRSDKDWA
jgi:hypothetical protein